MVTPCPAEPGCPRRAVVTAPGTTDKVCRVHYNRWVRAGSYQPTVKVDWDDLHDTVTVLAARGWTRDRIAADVGVQWNTITRRYRRHAQPLPHPFNQHPSTRPLIPPTTEPTTRTRVA